MPPLVLFYWQTHFYIVLTDTILHCTDGHIFTFDWRTCFHIPQTDIFLHSTDGHIFKFDWRTYFHIPLTEIISHSTDGHIFTFDWRTYFYIRLTDIFWVFGLVDIMSHYFISCLIFQNTKEGAFFRRDKSWPLPKAFKYC